MPIPPILDVFVVWHPDDRIGAERFVELHEHFHSPAFSGLAGGAVEVYARSEPWTAEESAPRPLGIGTPLSNGLPAAQFNAIIPVIDTSLARAVADPRSRWGDYIREIATLNQRNGVGVYPVVADGFRWGNTVVNEILGESQTLPTAVNTDSGLFGRELAQAITQRIQHEEGLPTRLKVFVSHTKHRSHEEITRAAPVIFDRVRARILQTHLKTFFDAQDIQPGDDWERVLEDGAASSALLMLRTDLYAGRDWTQREVRTAKRSGMPVVCMYALTAGEERGSFLMDHVPSVVCDLADPDPGIDLALNRLVDEALKNTLWRAQTSYLSKDGFDWLPAQSPEPTTLAPWLAAHRETHPDDSHLWVIHPDPPLGPAESGVLFQLCALAGYDVDVDMFTPRTFAARGGSTRRINEPTLVRRDALTGQKIALSVSESADLARLGLKEQHCRLVVAEVGRAIMLAGGIVVYGGNLEPGGYTEILVEEAQRFSGGRRVLEIALAESEYRKFDEDALVAADRELRDVGSLTLVSAAGSLVSVRTALAKVWSQDQAEALTAMRKYVANRTTARVVVGGRLTDYTGAEPGVIEEARLTIQAGRPLLAAGGYGGAAAAVARRLRPQDFEGWAPENYPLHAEDGPVDVALGVLADVYAASLPPSTFDESLLHVLAVSHRPGDIATATVQLLSRVVPEEAQ